MKNVVERCLFCCLALGVIASAGRNARAQSYVCDTPKAITTPEQAVARVRADLLEPYFWRGYSDADMKTLSNELLTLHVVPLDTNASYHYYDEYPGTIQGNDAHYFWGVQLPNRDETFLVNRKTGFVTIGGPFLANRPVRGVTIPYGKPFHFTRPYGPYYEPKVPDKDMQDDSQPVVDYDRLNSKEFDTFSVHHYRVRERATDYVLIVLFNPEILGSPNEYEFSLSLSTMSEWTHPEAKSKIFARFVHVQNMESVSVIISKEDLRTYTYITGWTVGPNAGGGSTFTISKPPADQDHSWQVVN